MQLSRKARGAQPLPDSVVVARAVAGVVAAGLVAGAAVLAAAVEGAAELATATVAAGVEARWVVLTTAPQLQAVGQPLLSVE